MPLKTAIRIRGLFLFGGISAAFLLSTACHAQAPCDFKGVSVGDRLTPAQLMSALGVTTYKINPKLPSFEDQLPNIQKYGINAAGEIRDWKTGPYCDETSCKIPFGVTVGNSNTPVSMFVALRGGLVTEIDVAFNQTFWNEILPILESKYGRTWKVERDPYFLLTNLETKEGTQVERITLTHQRGGINKKTRDACQIWVTNYDVVFFHHDPLGAFHSMFVIKLVSKNF